MKLRYILTSVVAACALFVGCQKETPNVLEEVQVSSSYVALPADGGSTTITVTAKESWSINSMPEWVTITPASGSAGETKVTFSAEKATETNEGTVYIECGGKKQTINIIQMTEKTETPVSTCAEVLAGPDSKTYRVTGAVTKITETATYGNFYINDGTGEVYIYGTKYQGQTKQAALEKLGVEVGDILTIEGPKTTYNGTVELVDVDVISIVKSLLKLEGEDSYKVEKEANDIDIKVAYKGNGVKVETDQPWLTLAGIDVQKDTAYIKIHVAENVEDTRTGIVTVSTSIPGQDSALEVTVTQATGLSMYSMPYSENFASGQGAFEVKVIADRTDGKSIWSAGSYGSSTYMKASAGSKIDTKSMLISPKISLAGATSPVLTFSQCGKYCGNQDEELTVWVSTDGAETWSQLLIPNKHDNAYTWVNSGDISLAKFLGNDYVQVAFQYISNSNYYGTWEITDVKVEDRALVVNSIAELDNAATSSKVEYTVNLTDAKVTYVNGNNAFIEDATAGVQVYASSHGLVAGDVLNGEVKFTITLYSGYPEATAIDYSAATKTTAEVTPTVITLDRLNKEYLRHICCYCKVEDVTFATGADGSAKVNDTMTQGEASVATRTQVKTLAYEAGKAYDVVCIPVTYNSNPQVSIYEAPVAK